jgi:hypothetical protein
VKRVALKGLQRTGPRPFAVWLEHLRQEAVAEQRRQRPRRGSGTGTRATASWMATLHDVANRVLGQGHALRVDRAQCTEVRFESVH